MEKPSIIRTRFSLQTDLAIVQDIRLLSFSPASQELDALLAQWKYQRVDHVLILSAELTPGTTARNSALSNVIQRYRSLLYILFPSRNGYHSLLNLGRRLTNFTTIGTASKRANVASGLVRTSRHPYTNQQIELYRLFSPAAIDGLHCRETVISQLQYLKPTIAVLSLNQVEQDW